MTFSIIIEKYIHQYKVRTAMSQNGTAEKKYLIFKEIIAAVVHDMKNPLSAITLGLEFIQMVGGEGKVPPQAISGALTSAARMDQLLDALSLYFHDEAEAATAVELSHVITKAQLLVNYYMARNQIKFKLENLGDEKAVLANINQTFQALVMLLVAMARHAASGTVITATINNDHHWQTLTMAVSGSDNEALWKELDPNSPQPELATACFELAGQLLARNGFVLEHTPDVTRSQSVIVKKSIDGQAAANGAGR
jgi:C4-dicarboxylate-specific signal transduction histidine kinase